MKQVKKFKLIPFENDNTQLNNAVNRLDNAETSPISPSQAPSLDSNQRKLSDEKILMCIPQSGINKAKALLGYLHEIPNIGWMKGARSLLKKI